MLRRASDCSSPPLTSAKPAVPQAIGQAAYGARFWWAYAANTLIMVGVALLYRYADFVTILGGDEFHLGWIVGLGMVGSLSMRLVLGQAIDCHGPGRIWTASLVLFALACFAHLAVEDGLGPAVFILRIVWCCAVAGIFGASITFISNTVPKQRIAELVGMLGTSGFLGMMLGSWLGDVLLGGHRPARWQVDAMFVGAGLLALASALFVLVATRGARVRRRRHAPIGPVLRRYQPGMVLLMGLAMGLGLNLPTTFLRTFAGELGIAQLGWFFGIYAPAAVIMRMVGRTWPERFGLKRVILLGTLGVALSTLSFLLVRSPWHLLLPGIGFGMAHAVVFPAVVAAGSVSFPQRHRGLGTTLVLAAFDVGNLLGAPAAGAVIVSAKAADLPPYDALFALVALFLLGCSAVYALIGRQPEAPRPRRAAVAVPASRSHPHHAPDSADLAGEAPQTLAP